jgi:ferredoxin
MNETQERRISGLTIVIDRDVCIGSDSCTRIAPEVFELDPDAIVTFRADAPDIERDRLVESCKVCPVDALTATDADGRRLAP